MSASVTTISVTSITFLHSHSNYYHCISLDGTPAKGKSGSINTPYTATWDVKTVLDFMKARDIHAMLTVHDCDNHVTSTLQWTTGTGFTGLDFGLYDFTCTLDSCVFYINKVLKTSRPGKHVSPI